MDFPPLGPVGSHHHRHRADTAVVYLLMEFVFPTSQSTAPSNLNVTINH